MCPSLQNVEVGHYGRSRVWVHAEWWQACECGLHMLESLNFVQVRSLIGSLCHVMSHQRSACQQDALYKLFLSLIQLIWCNFFNTWMAVYEMHAVWTDQLVVHFRFLLFVIFHAKVRNADQHWSCMKGDTGKEMGLSIYGPSWAHR